MKAKKIQPATDLENDYINLIPISERRYSYISKAKRDLKILQRVLFKGEITDKGRTLKLSNADVKIEREFGTYGVFCFKILPNGNANMMQRSERIKAGLKHKKEKEKAAV